MLNETTGSAMGEVVTFSSGGSVGATAGTVIDLRSALDAMNERHRQEREQLARDLLMQINARKNVHREALRALDAEEQAVLKECGGALPTGVELPRVFVRRKRDEEAERIASVPVERLPSKPAASVPPTPTKVQDAILYVLGTAEDMTRNELADAVERFWPGKYARTTVETSLSVMSGDDIINSEPSRRAGDHRLAKVYSLKRTR